MGKTLFTEVPNGASGGFFFVLTAEGRQVWDGERGTLKQAELVMRLIRRGDVLTPKHMKLRGVPGPTVLYRGSFVGVPAESRRIRLLALHRGRPQHCRCGKSIQTLMSRV